jgi:hypothetical protein
MKRRRQTVATTQQYIGAGLVSIAAFAVSVALGLLTVGVCLVAFGLASELGGN